MSSFALPSRYPNFSISSSTRPAARVIVSSETTPAGDELLQADQPPVRGGSAALPPAARTTRWPALRASAPAADCGSRNKRSPHATGSGPGISMSSPLLMKSVACVAPQSDVTKPSKPILLFQDPEQCIRVAARVPAIDPVVRAHDRGDARLHRCGEWRGVDLVQGLGSTQTSVPLVS